MSGCSDSSRPPNVVLIVVDTLRYDHVGCYGSERETTPNMDAFASDAVRFQRAYSTAPWTMPSVASMLTGLYPGACRPADTWDLLAEELTTLPEVFRAQGYATAGIISHFLIGPRFNYDQGFDTFIDDEANADNMHGHVSSEALSRQASEVLNDLSSKAKPFFLFVHYFDPHYDYQRHPEYGYASESAGRLDGKQTIEHLRELSDMTSEESRFLKSLYDEEIRYTDQGIGMLLDELRRLELYDHTIVAITADHGEEFLDHGWLGHTRTLYEELIRVPLIIRAPGIERPAREVESPVSLVSLASSLLDLAGVNPAGIGSHGASFAPMMRADGPRPSTIIFSEASFDSSMPADLGKKTNKKSIIWERYKLVRDESSGELELYDLKKDPEERTDLSETSESLLQSLLPMLDERILASRPSESADTEDVELTEDELDRLRDLGYVGR
jgi:arylsulfatase A-like enzyme